MSYLSAFLDVARALRARKLSVLIPLVALVAIFLSPIALLIGLRNFIFRSFRKKKAIKETEKELYPLW